MFVNFFIDRPVFSTVIALVIVIAGLVCIPFLPVAQFPDITPPTVSVSTVYTGANAEVVELTTTAPLEQQINGVEGMTYMSSQSSNDGSANITVTFDIGYDLNIAAIDVQNRVDRAMPQIPEDVRRYGVTTQKKSTDFILAITLISPDGSLDDLELSNYAAINIVDILKRIYGVGDVQIFGERKYSMRFWLDPDRLTGMDVTAQEVINAIRDQNIQVAAGGIGEPPSPSGQVFQYTITTKGRLEDVSEFENIILRTREDGAVVRMKDVADIELGAESYRQYSNLNAGSAITMGVYQLAGANSINIAKQARQTMRELSAHFPKGIEYTVPYDTTMFVTASIHELIITLLITVILVFSVIYVFLQDWRSTMVPAVVIPVSLIGTFGIMMAFGFSINTLTLFGLVLAIGLVVDDSIVVVENVSRLIEEEGLPPKEAAKKGMAEVVGPVIATTLVLFAVFVPVAFIPGISGQLYKQFALTIAFSVGISSINAMSLSPAMCALMLKPKGERRGWFFTKFNSAFALATHIYEKGVAFFIKRWKIIVAAFAVLLLATFFVFRHLPIGFIPDEDQGYFYALVQGPEGTSLNRTHQVANQMEKMAMDLEGVEHVLTIGGYNIINNTADSSAATLIVVLKPWDDRKSEKLSLDAIMQKLQYQSHIINEALTFTFNPPPIRGLSTMGGLQFELQDRSSGSLQALGQVAKRFIEEASRRPELSQLSTTFKLNYPQFYIDLDRTKAKSLQIPISDIFDVLQTYLGSLYVNDFNKYGRVYRVYAQAKDDYRSDVGDISALYVRSDTGEMVPLSTLVKVKEIRGAQTVMRYNLYRTVEINGANAMGYSSGDAINAMEETAAKVLPEGYSYEWSGVAYQEIEAGNLAVAIFLLAILFVYLFLCAQYESWTMPLIIMLAVPLAMLGALSSQWIRGLFNDVYCQIGLVMLIGLASKNAILIVEFAKTKREEGMAIVDAILEASRIRLRPILMTAMAFILGVVPLLVARGAGAASRHSLGTTVFGGMVAATFLSLVLIPVLFVVIERLRERGIKFVDFKNTLQSLIAGSRNAYAYASNMYVKVKNTLEK